MGLAMTHHPHNHASCPAAALRRMTSAWIGLAADFFLRPVLSRLFRRLMCEALARLHACSKALGSTVILRRCRRGALRRS